VDMHEVLRLATALLVIAALLLALIAVLLVAVLAEMKKVRALLGPGKVKENRRVLLTPVELAQPVIGYASDEGEEV
jgi:hypothetical protein